MNELSETEALKLANPPHRLCFDVELTNRCNALCSFCPRDKTPAQGFISDKHFYAALDFAERENIFVSLTGQGESMIHPKFIEYVREVKRRGLRCQLTTNASLMTESLTDSLLDIGLDKINFSVSNLWGDYESVYNLSFDKTIKNIKYFVAKNKSRCVIQISIVKNKENEKKHKEMRRFWEDIGVDKSNIEILDQSTRAGACETEHLFVRTDHLRIEAKEIAIGNDVLGCLIPFAVPAIGWNGNHYLCCHDYEKADPLGSVDALDLIQVNKEKSSRVVDSDHSICRKCSLDPVGQIQECLLRIEKGEYAQSELAQLIDKLKRQRRKLKGIGEDCG